MRAIDEAIASRSEYSVEYRVVRDDGEVRWLQDRGRVILDDTGASSIGDRRRDGCHRAPAARGSRARALRRGVPS